MTKANLEGLGRLNASLRGERVEEKKKPLSKMVKAELVELAEELELETSGTVVELRDRIAATPDYSSENVDPAD